MSFDVLPQLLALALVVLNTKNHLEHYISINVLPLLLALALASAKHQKPPRILHIH